MGESYGDVFLAFLDAVLDMDARSAHVNFVAVLRQQRSVPMVEEIHGLLGLVPRHDTSVRIGEPIQCTFVLQYCAKQAKLPVPVRTKQYGADVREKQSALQFFPQRLENCFVMSHLWCGFPIL